MSFLKWLSWFYGFSTTHPTTHHSIIEPFILELWLESFLWTRKKPHGIQLSQGGTWLFGDLIDIHHDTILGLFQHWNSKSFWMRRGYKIVGVITHAERERLSPNTLFFNVSKMNHPSRRPWSRDSKRRKLLYRELQHYRPSLLARTEDAWYSGVPVSRFLNGYVSLLEPGGDRLAGKCLYVASMGASGEIGSAICDDTNTLAWWLNQSGLDDMKRCGRRRARRRRFSGYWVWRLIVSQW
jgi:hypothetical protein